MQLELTRKNRRRLLLVAVPIVIVGGVAGIIEVVPTGKPVPRYSSSGPPRVTTPPAVSALGPKQVPVSAADRKAIDALLDEFVPDAIERKNPGTAYSLATPSLQRQATRAQWRQGAIPGSTPFDAKHVGFHSWSANYSFRNEVSLDLQLEPRDPRKYGPTSFRIDVKRRSGRWLVDSIYTVRVLPPQVGPQAKPTKKPIAKPQPAPDTGLNSRISQRWWIVIGLAIGLVILLPILIFGLNAWRNHRAAKRYARKLDV
jgi:hypothetical protein